MSEEEILIMELLKKWGDYDSKCLGFIQDYRANYFEKNGKTIYRRTANTKISKILISLFKIGKIKKLITISGGRRINNYYK